MERTEIIFVATARALGEKITVEFTNFGARCVCCIALTLATPAELVAQSAAIDQKVASRNAANSLSRDLAGHWSLELDCKDSSGHGNDGSNHGAQFGAEGRGNKSGRAARFDGHSQFIEVPDSDPLRLNQDDFSIAVWVNTDKLVDDTLGDILSKYDSVTRRGFHLSIMNYAGACTSTANTRNLFFGIDAGTNPKWTDCGRPGNNLLPYALAVFEGRLYAGTFEAGQAESGRVYRYTGGTNWLDCGSPDICNSVTALAVFQGRLFAATSRYNASGSHLPAAKNLNNGGKVFRYEGGKKWFDCGRVSDAEFIFGLVVFGGKLYATSMDAPPNQLKRPNQGLYRYDGDRRWTYCGNPGGRVAALAVSNGRLYGTGYNGGQLGGVFRYEGGTNWTNFGAPPGVDQTYSFGFHNGEMHVGTWKEGKVFRYNQTGAYSDAGRLGAELEVMGTAVYNGKLYAGTLPLAQVYRHDGGTNWALTGRLDFTDTEYRRAWSMAVYRGRLFCGTLPSGHVHSLEAGKAVTYDHELGAGWRHLIAMRHDRRLKLYVDGRFVAASTEFSPTDFDITNHEPLKIGFGAHDYFHGAMRDLRIYRRALTEAEVKRLSRSDAVGTGSVGRWPAVFSGPPNTSYAKPGDTNWFNLKSEAGSRRRAGDDRTRAACAPHFRELFQLNN